jgi:fucose 4-O-acetylase-like acetyltransferase
MSKRIEYIDIARGVGILLVVMGHNDFGYISSFAYQTIYSFHMPLFFFLSGYFLNVSTGFLDFVKRRFDTLIKPYLFTIFIIYFTSISFEKMGFRTAIFRITKSLYGVGHYLDWVQLWFLPHLFVVSLYAYFIFRLLNGLNNRVIKWVVLLVTLWMSTFFLQRFYPFSASLFGKDYELYGLPFSLDLVGLSGFFFVLGSEIKRMTSEKLFEKPALFFVSGASLILLNIFFRERIDLNTRVYESFLINTLEAVTGIFFILALSRQIELRTEKLASLFKYFGQISLFILIFHVPIQDFWGQKILAVTDNLTLSIWCGFIMGVAGSVLIYELFIKANPVALWWFGRKAETPEQKTVLTKG